MYWQHNNSLNHTCTSVVLKQKFVGLMKMYHTQPGILREEGTGIEILPQASSAKGGPKKQSAQTLYKID